jgi:hypothetical protein
MDAREAVFCWVSSGVKMRSTELQMCLLGGEGSDCGMELAGRSVIFAKYVSAFTSQTGKPPCHATTRLPKHAGYVHETRCRTGSAPRIDLLDNLRCYTRDMAP